MTSKKKDEPNFYLTVICHNTADGNWDKYMATSISVEGSLVTLYRNGTVLRQFGWSQVRMEIV